MARYATPLFDSVSFNFLGSLSYHPPNHDQVNFNIGAAGRDPRWGFCVLALNFKQSTVGSNECIDSSSYHKTTTPDAGFLVTDAIHVGDPLVWGNAIACPTGKVAVSTAGDANFNFAAQDFTISTWIKLSALPASGTGVWIASAWEGYRAWRFGLYNNAGTMRLRYEFYDTGAARHVVEANLPNPDPTDGFYRYGVDRYNNLLSIYQQSLHGVAVAYFAQTDVGTLVQRFSASTQIRVLDFSSPAAGWADNVFIHNGFSRFRGTMPVPDPEPEGYVSSLSMQADAVVTRRQITATMNADAVIGIQKQLSMDGDAVIGILRALTMNGDAVIGKRNQLTMQADAVVGVIRALAMQADAVIGVRRVLSMQGDAILGARHALSMDGNACIGAARHLSMQGDALVQRARSLSMQFDAIISSPEAFEPPDLNNRYRALGRDTAVYLAGADITTSTQ